MNMSRLVVSLLWIVGAYLVGGIPFGYLIGRMRGVDVRTVGSKNIGATNVFRTVGKKWGLLAFLSDVLKGLVPVLLAKAFASRPSWVPLAVGIACVVGHMLTPYMKFKGGKGVATAFGMLVALVPALVGVAFLLFAVTFALSHYISLGSCAAALFLGVAVWFEMPALGSPGWVGDKPLCVLMTLLAAFVIFKHRANLGRLVRGEENKIYLFGKPKA